MSKIPTTGNQVKVRKNAGSVVGTRPQINFAEGANITLTITDSVPNNEVVVTIASSGGGGGDWVRQYFPAVDCTAFKGTYPSVEMSDGVDSDVYHGFMIPGDVATISRAVVLVIPNAAGNMRWSCSTNFGAVCSNESYQIHTDSIAANDSAVTMDEIECIDISAALTGALGDDLVGLKFTRVGSHANDTVGASVHYVGVLIEGTT